MDKVFIGWGGNQPLAKEVANALKDTNFLPVLGGGTPKDTFIGAQVFSQMQSCVYAILLVENKELHEGGERQISPNLMFEWGYLMASMPIKNIHTFLINTSPRELPSDLLGSWVTEVQDDRTAEDSDKNLAQKICQLFIQDRDKEDAHNYFDVISQWPQVRVALQNTKDLCEREICEYVVFGCLAAYYYMDNHWLLSQLHSLPLTGDMSVIMRFAKSYINIFLETKNMTLPLPQTVFFEIMQEFESIIAREKKLSEGLDAWIDILSYDAYGLASQLFLRNEGLDDTVRQHCGENAKNCFKKTLQLVAEFEEKNPLNTCLIQLIRAYIYNDFAHLYEQFFEDNATYQEYLAKSVSERKNLHQSYKAKYPDNTFLATKFEQEYMVALSEQCLHMPESFMRKVSFDTIEAKYNEWHKELAYTSSLTDRIKNNLNKLRR